MTVLLVALTALAALPALASAEMPRARSADVPGLAPLPPATDPDGPDRVVAGANVARILFATTATSKPGGGRALTRIAPLAPFGRGEAQYALDAQRVIGGRLYVRLLLPLRPNGTRGWVPGDDVGLLRTRYAVTIDLRARRLTVLAGGRRAKAFPIVVGALDSPTPRGRFAISELLPQRPADGFFGSWIVPLTAFSDTYTEFRGGPGRVAIHGRGGASLLDPLGTASSHGCIRLANAAVDWLAGRLEAGVPVTIR